MLYSCWLKNIWKKQEFSRIGFVWRIHKDSCGRNLEISEYVWTGPGRVLTVTCLLCLAAMKRETRWKTRSKARHEEHEKAFQWKKKGCHWWANQLETRRRILFWPKKGKRNAGGNTKEGTTIYLIEKPFRTPFRLKKQVTYFPSVQRPSQE